MIFVSICIWDSMFIFLLFIWLFKLFYMKLIMKTNSFIKYLTINITTSVIMGIADKRN